MSKSNVKGPHINKSNIQKQNILHLSQSEACEFFMKHNSYCSSELPPYISFEPILENIDSYLKGKKISDFFANDSDPKTVDNINHIIFHNKDGRYAWRPIQLIHPVLYVSLVHRITEDSNWETICNRFKVFSQIDKIECTSIPIISNEDEKIKQKQILHWWETTEQESIKKSLDYEYLIHTDISNCYGALYTHSVTWAILNIEEAKEKENRQNKRLIGNIIDTHLQQMSYGQTNGIPQGSVLMDFIAETVLGYIDTLLSKKLAENKMIDYHIIRYRDDYRIFINSLRDGEKIIKCMSEILMVFGMTLNPNKTKPTSQVIKGAIKIDKLYWLQQKEWIQSLQKHLLLIHDLSIKFPNSGSLIINLGKFYDRIEKKRKKPKDIYQLISIVVDITYHNPKTYQVSAPIISQLIKHIDKKEEQRNIIEKIRKKLEKIPNTGHLDIWLQRVVIGFDESISFNEPICKLVANEDNISIWKKTWLKGSLREKIRDQQIVNKEELDKVRGEPIKRGEFFIVSEKSYLLVKFYLSNSFLNRRQRIGSLMILKKKEK